MDLKEDILPLESRTQQGFSDWIVRTMSQWIDDPSETVDPHHPFMDCSLDSVAALRLLGMLEVLLDRPMPPELFERFPTPNLLAGYLSDLAEGA